MVAKNQWPDTIPGTYDELQEMYGPFISSLIQRHNKVDRNFRDIHNHVWERLLNSDVIGKYEFLTQGRLPKTMVRNDACIFLGVTEKQWRYAMSRYHEGYTVQGEKRHGHWMPQPINMAEFTSTKKGLFSQDTLFDTDDLLKLADEYADEDGYAVSFFPNRGPLVWPETKVTPAHFRNYLATAVRNHFNNFCRTESRRHKERLHDTFAQFRRRDREEPMDWEASLKDHTGARQETMIALTEVTTKLKLTLRASMEGVDSCKPVEAHETEMFELLGQGHTLPQVVKRMDIPRFVKLAVLRSVQPRPR